MREPLEAALRARRVPRFSLRQATLRDARFLWKLRNGVLVRRTAFSSGHIPYRRHREWFKTRIGAGNCWIFIAHEKGKRIGQVRFDTDDGKSTEIDVSIVAKERGKGYGTAVIKQACRKILGMTRLSLIVCHIKGNNLASRKAFKKAGFSSRGLRVLHGRVACRMVLKRKNVVK